jgi:hypothetical protein
MADIIKCPDCGGLVSIRFPIHVCRPKRKPKGKAKKR